MVGGCVQVWVMHRAIYIDSTLVMLGAKSQLIQSCSFNKAYKVDFDKVPLPCTYTNFGCPEAQADVVCVCPKPGSNILIFLSFVIFFFFFTFQKYILMYCYKTFSSP